MKSFFRKRTFSEKLYIAGSHFAPPFCIRLVVQTNQPIAKDVLQKAVSQSSEVHPNSRLRLVGSNWEDTGIAPIVVALPKSDQPFSMKVHADLDKPIDVQNDPTSEVYQIEVQDAYYTIFKVSHATMDAKGTELWVSDVYRALRGETLIGAQEPTTDESFLKAQTPKKEYRKLYPLNAFPMIGEKKKQTELSFVRSSIAIPGQPPGIIAKLIHYFSKENEINRFMIPVDIRRHASNPEIGGNFSNPIFYETSTKKDWNTIYADLISQLNHKKELITGQYDQLLKGLPTPLFKRIQHWLHKKQVKQGEFLVSGILSHVGKLSLEDYSIKEVKATAVFFVAIDIPNTASSFAITENDHQTFVQLSVPSGITTKSEVQEALKGFLRYIQGDVEIQDASDIFPLHGEQFDFDENISISKWFYNQVQQYPDRIAIYDKGVGVGITYSDMYQDVNALAAVLKERYHVKGQIIAIHAKRSAELIKSMFAVLKAGATFLLIDDGYPEQRIQYILKDSNTPLVLSDTDMDYGSQFQKIRIDQFDFVAHYTEITEPELPSEIAYVLYTSGSTGNPKGVKVSDPNLLNYVHYIIQYMGMGEESNHPLFTSVSFDLTITPFFVPLLSGGSITTYPDAISTQQLTDIFNDPNHTAVKLTPSHLKLVKLIDVNPNHTIKYLLVGGEDFPIGLAKSIQEQLGDHVAIYNAYGPTEATVGCVFHKFDKENDADEFSVPIGLPMYNADAYILNQKLQPVGPEEIGELYIGGKGVTQGYLGKPELTNKKFISNPMQPEETLYQTGDLVYLGKRGLLHYQGRTDDQIKINGHRIEIAEIEHTIAKHEGIEEVVVVPHEHQINENSSAKILSAFYKPSTVEVTKIKSFLEPLLPSYMIPSRLIGVDQIPYNNNGKVDKTKLLGLYIENSSAEEIPTAEVWEEREDTIRGIFANILNIKPFEIEKETLFYDLGGDSLSMLFLINSLEKQFLTTYDKAKWGKISMQMIAEPNVIKICELLDEMKEG